jgi:phosphopantetheine adenylyltransferase
MKIDLLIGRFQPIHKGHAKIIKSMTNPIVVIVKGKKSSEDIARNPLSADDQKRMIHKIFPDLEVSISPNGFLPGILGYFRKQDKEVTKIYSGADRIEGYKAAIDKANEKMKPEEQYKVDFQETERVTSASAVRKAIKDDDYETFKNLVPKEIHDEWDFLKKALNKAVNESFEIMTFSDWLKEEGIPVLTTNIATKDFPFMKMARRKKIDNEDDDEQITQFNNFSF